MKYLVAFMAVLGLGLLACGGGGGLADSCDEYYEKVKTCEGEDGVTASAIKTVCDAIRTTEEAGVTCTVEGDADLYPDIYECTEEVWTLKEGEEIPTGTTGYTCS